jgi:putative ATPase
LESFIEKMSLQVNGDARLALNILSVLGGFSPRELAELSEADVYKEIFSQLRQYDKNGNRHYDIISAFIKSIRGSHVDAALLWLAVMLDGGEDPEFIARRLMIIASEDIGLANNQALQVAANAHYVIKTIGMPEARITLGHAVIYLALSPKSNSAYLAIDKALSFVKENPTLSIPNHLSNTIGKDYRYPHDDPRSWVEQSYLAPECSSRFYQGKLEGMEPKLAEWINSRQ